MNLTSRLTGVLILTCASFAGAIRATAQQSIQEDCTGVYRPQPEIERDILVRVPPDEIKPGLAYNYYNELLRKRVWGFARKDGSFEYAFGEGTNLPVDRFDLRLSQETEEGVLEKRSPGLRSSLEITGGIPAVELSADGEWRLLPVRVSARVFDLETGRRWEWHGDRRVAVLHTYGDRWQVVDGRYRPLSGLPFTPEGCIQFYRADSAAHVTRSTCL